MSKAKKRLRVACAILMLAVIAGTVAGFFLEPYFSDKATKEMLKDPDAYVTDTARSPWIYVSEDGVASLNGDACVGREEIVIPDAVNGIRVSGFDMQYARPPQNVKNIVFPKTLRHVAGYPFDGWESIEEIVFQDGISDLSAFYVGAKANLKKIVFPRTLTALRSTVLDGANPDLVIHFGGTEEAWQALGNTGAKLSARFKVVFESEG